MPLLLLIPLLIAAPLVVAVTTRNPWAALLAFLMMFVVNRLVRVLRKNRYFASEHFQAIKAANASLVGEHNEVVGYLDEIRASGAFELGSSTSGQHAHLASFENNSSWNYRRDRNVATYAPHIHHASLQVVRNASADPIKYLMKYFSVRADHETLSDVQRVANDIARLEAAVGNVHEREVEIVSRTAPPKFIRKHYTQEFWDQVGARLSPLQVPYPRYSFDYVSAGGNSAQSTKIVLDTPTLEALSETLAEKIRRAKSAAGQRALMTSRLRRFIKSRDNETCRKCGISTMAEPHLLLEVDHIMPLSRGGLSVPDNLQTLCWRCNRSKGARIGV